MDVSVFQDVGLIREKIVFAFVAGAIAFLAWEARARRRGAERAGGRTGPVMAGALAGAAAFVAGFQVITGQLWG